jgi:hypothetical protein
MTLLYAQPFDPSATGFFFETAEEYALKANAARNSAGHPVEEFELQFIDGEPIDAALFEALGVSQVNLATFLERAIEWDTNDKQRVIVAVGECGYSFDLETDRPDNLDVDIYPVETLRELAEQFVDEGLFGDIPERVRYYLEYDAIARDLGFDYRETTIAGDRLVYRCG